MDFILGEVLAREEENKALRNRLTIVHTSLQTLAEGKEARVSEFRKLENRLTELEQAREVARALPWWKRLWAASRRGLRVPLWE